MNTNFNQDNGLAARLTMAVMKPFSRTPEKGAETLVWLAESTGFTNQSGYYYADKQVGKCLKLPWIRMQQSVYGT